MLFKNKKMSRIVALLLTAALSFSTNSFVFAGENSSSVLLGDVNGDGKVNSDDASLALSYVLKPNEVQGFNADVADVNGNDVIDSVDVALILQKALDSSFKFPIEDVPTVTNVTNWKEFKTAAATAKEGDTISLSNDISADGSAIFDVDGVSGATLVVKEKNVTILGNGHTVKSDGTNTFTFDFDGGANETAGTSGAKGVNVKDLTIDGASFKKKIGGGMFLEAGADVTLTNVTMKNCNAGATSAFNGGGAVYVNYHRGETPTLTAVNSTFENNSVGDGTTGRGGAIYGSTGNVVLENCTFKGNKAGYGGAVAMDGKLVNSGEEVNGSLSVTDCTFVDNDGVNGGDDIYIYEGTSAGKKGKVLTSNIDVKNISGTFSGETTDDFKDYDVVYSRYYADTYVGDKTKTAPKFDGVTVHDITFPTQDRDTLEVPTTTTTTTESTTQTTTTTTTETTTETTTTTTTETTEATTAVYKGSETVEVYGYDVKVAVAVDGDGKIISVLDDNTDTQDMFNEMFYSKAIAMFKNFIGKTASELDDVDGVSSATYSSNAIRGAVKNALSSIPASLDLSSNFVSGGAVNANSSFAEVALKSSNDSANIFYTTDGTEPNENSNKYDGSIKLTAADITSSSKKVVD
ncbi:MAG: FMN-binding protein [Clostridia bacterium]|nr:FMN-binding protein [Clostridia bacterium]